MILKLLKYNLLEWENTLKHKDNIFVDVFCNILHSFLKIYIMVDIQLTKVIYEF